MHFDRHQKIAIGLYLFTVLYLFVRDDFEKALEQSVALFVLLLGIIYYRLIAYFAGFGFPEIFAKDYGSENHPGPYAVLFWILFLFAWAFVFFQ
ncbi:MAG: hypothetical protein ABFS39_04730 [Pseudomonadota bacterium]